MSNADGHDATASQTENEYEKPGGNYPDRGGADETAVDEVLTEPSTEKEPAEEPVAPEPEGDEASHQAVGVGVIDNEIDAVGTAMEPGAEPPDAAGARTTEPMATASDAPQPTGDGTAQAEPAMDQNIASDEDKIAGIALQTRHDVGDADPSRIEEVLAQRFRDAGLEVGAERLSALAREVAES